MTREIKLLERRLNSWKIAEKGLLGGRSDIKKELSKDSFGKLEFKDAGGYDVCNTGYYVDNEQIKLRDIKEVGEII